MISSLVNVAMFTSIAGVVAIFTIVFTQIIANKLKSKLRSQTKKVNLFSLNSLTYLALSIVALTMPVVLSFFIKNVMLLYVIMFIYSLSLGAIHLITHYKYVKWAEKAVDILPDILYTFIIAIMSTITFVFLYQAINGGDGGFIRNFFFIMMPFLIGMFVLKTVTSYKQVPDLTYETYKISEGDKRVSPNEVRNSSIRAVSFLLKLNQADEKKSKIAANLYSDIEFGINVFQILRQYNGKPELPNIETTDSSGGELEYVFYKKPNFLGIKKLIDPYKSVLDNNINSKSQIVFQVLKQQEEKTTK